MSDTISSFAMYAALPDTPLQRVLSAALNEDWTLETDRTGDFVYRVKEERRTTELLDDVLRGVDEVGHAATAIERGDLRVWIEKESDVLPTVETWHLYIWGDKYQFGHEGDARTQEEARERVRTYVDLVQIAVEETSPDYGFGKFGMVASPKVVPTAGELRMSTPLDAFWLNVFDPDGVDRIGRDVLLDAPAWEVRELDTGHVMVIASDNPFEPDDEWVDAEEELRAYLSEHVRSIE